MINNGRYRYGYTRYYGDIRADGFRYESKNLRGLYNSIVLVTVLCGCGIMYAQSLNNIQAYSVGFASSCAMNAFVKTNAYKRPICLKNAFLEAMEKDFDFETLMMNGMGGGAVGSGGVGGRGGSGCCVDRNRTFAHRQEDHYYEDHYYNCFGDHSNIRFWIVLTVNICYGVVIGNIMLMLVDYIQYIQKYKSYDIWCKKKYRTQWSNGIMDDNGMFDFQMNETDSGVDWIDGGFYNEMITKKGRRGRSRTRSTSSEEKRRASL